MLTSMARTSHEASSSYMKQWMYDVFLSFRGVDTRNNFTGHLYMTLKEAGINAFIDENNLRRGEDITAELVQTIQGSKISVVVFSRRYAYSSWCLQELVKIMECRKTIKQIVLPIFYDIDPSDVRKQTGSFAQAFRTHEVRFQSDIDRVQRWRCALFEAANLSGWDLRNTDNGHEAKFIRGILNDISRRLNSKSVCISVYPVGIKSRVEDMCSYLGVGSSDVRIVGIWGMGGIGKTTIAKAIYNILSGSFEAKSFLANVRESSKQPNGLETLQEKLLYDVLPPMASTKINVGNVHSRVDVIKHRLGSKRVLLIMDDVDHMDQLYALSVNRESFGRGSRIIVTTRDEHLLRQLEVDRIFPAQKMNDEEALELLSWHAFRHNCPGEGYLELSKSVVAYCAGLPLALEVLGSLLFRRKTEYWINTLKKLKQFPCGKILEQLKISFEGLSDETERDIFLDIACFFIGMDKNYVVQVLDGCGLFAQTGISVLLERCLISVREENKLMMHDMLRVMGRNIIHERSLNNRGKCSRLWHHQDVIDVLSQKSGTEEIQGLALNLLRPDDEAIFSTEAFTNMKRLRLLQLDYAQLTGTYKVFSKELRWLCWHGCPLKFIPKDFKLRNIVAIDLQYSKLTQVWEDSGLLASLKILNLCHSHYLRRSPDFSYLPNLEQLILKDCISLFQVHPSIGHLQRLALVNLEDSKVLKDLPESFYRLKSIETLVLSGCSNFEILSEDLGKMESLETLVLDNTAISSIPASIGRLKNLKKLSLCGLKRSRPKSLPSRVWSLLFSKSTTLLPPSLSGLYSLTELRLRDSGLTNDAVPEDLGSLSSLVILDLGSNSISRLPSLRGLSKLKLLTLDGCKLTDDAIEHMDLLSLSSLWSLDLSGNSFCILPCLRGHEGLGSLTLDNCTNLREVIGLPTSMVELYVSNCSALERMPHFSDGWSISNLEVKYCPKLIEFPGLDDEVLNWGFIDLIGCTGLPASVKKTILRRCNELGRTTCGGNSIQLSENDIPQWFTYINNEGGSVSFAVPREMGCNLQELIVCAVYSHDAIVNHTKRTAFSWEVLYPGKSSSCKVLWQAQLSNSIFNLKGGDLVQVDIGIGSSAFIVHKVGVNLETDTFINEHGFENFGVVSLPYYSGLGDDDEEEDLDDDEAADDDRPHKRFRSDPGCHDEVELHSIDQWSRDTSQGTGTQIAVLSPDRQGRRYYDVCMEPQCMEQEIQIQQQQLEIERLRQLIPGGEEKKI